MTSRNLLSMICSLGGAAMLTILFISTPAAAGGPICVERAKLLQGLTAKYNEQRKGVGITSAETGALEFYASEKGTWTIVVTTTGGQTCILATGHSWHAVPAAALGPGA